MNVLVIGGTGFIGSHVVDHLVAAGCNVRVFDQAQEKFRTPLQNVEYVLGSFDDSSLLAESLQGIDMVYHLISTTVPSTSNLDPEFDIQTNLINTLHLLDLMRKNEIYRIVYLSSGGAVYGNAQHSPVKEDHQLNPICSYGIVKVAIENYLYMYQHLYDFRPVIIRPSNPYGPRQGHAGTQGLIGTFLNKILNHQTLEVWGDGSVVRDYVFIGDLANLCAAVAFSDAVGVFNAGSGVGHSINDVLNILNAIVDEDIVKKYKGARSFDVEHIVLDISRATECFDWKPEIKLEKGVSEYLKWIKSNKDCI